jgi:hypothetical protein
MSDSTGFDIGPPGPGGGFDKAAHVEHVLTFVNPVAEDRDGRDGSYSVALCTFVVCHTCRLALTDVPVSGKALAPRINNGGSEIVAGVLVTGEAKAGRNPAYLLEEASAEQLDAVADDYAKFATKLPSGKIVVDVDSYNDAAF